MGSKSSVNIRVLLKLKGELHKVGDVTLKTFSGDIYYSPSSKQYLDENSEKIDIIHFSYHKSGYIHLKHRNKPNKPIRKGLSIKNIGYQELFRDLIVEPTKLPVFGERIRASDVVFNSKKHRAAILFSLAIISGKLILKRYRGEPTPLNFRLVQDNKKVLGLEKRVLGYESGNSDKLLQFFLIKAEGDFSKLTTKRRIKVMPNQKVTNN